MSGGAFGPLWLDGGPFRGPARDPAPVQQPPGQPQDGEQQDAQHGRGERDDGDDPAGDLALPDGRVGQLARPCPPRSRPAVRPRCRPGPAPRRCAAGRPARSTGRGPRRTRPRRTGNRPASGKPASAGPRSPGARWPPGPGPRWRTPRWSAGPGRARPAGWPPGTPRPGPAAPRSPPGQCGGVAGWHPGPSSGPAPPPSAWASASRLPSSPLAGPARSAGPPLARTCSGGGPTLQTRVRPGDTVSSRLGKVLGAGGEILVESSEPRPVLPQLRLDDLLTELQSRLQTVLATRDRVYALLEAVVAVGANLDLEMVLKQIVEAAITLVRARYGALGIIGEDGRLVEFVPVGLTEGADRWHPPLAGGPGPARRADPAIPARCACRTSRPARTRTASRPGTRRCGRSWACRSGSGTRCTATST